MDGDTMRNLYIDFDGVISDTIEVTYQMMKDRGIDKSDLEGVALFYQELDWAELLETTPLINNSMEKIQKILNSNKFDVAILTHVISLKEAVAKIKYIRKFLEDITIIPVPKAVSKTETVCARDSILVDDFKGNLAEWEEAGGIGVRFSKYKKESKYIDISDLEELLALSIDKC